MAHLPPATFVTPPHTCSLSHAAPIDQQLLQFLQTLERDRSWPPEQQNLERGWSWSCPWVVAAGLAVLTPLFVRYSQG